jgi:DNA-binding transcriptional ArsR family regulator
MVSHNLRCVAAYHIQLDALGDTTRRTLVERLRRGPTSVAELARDVPVSRPAVSQHLRVLTRARLVRHRTAGTRHLYELDPYGFQVLRAYFDSFWSDALDAFKTKLEESDDAKP